MDQIYEVVGYRKYEGEYEGKAYSGFFVHCIVPSNRKGFIGKECTEIKVKSRFNYVPSIGDMIKPIYNQYGLCGIELI